MKTNKTILVASSSMLAAGMAQGAITYTPVNQVLNTSDAGYDFDLNSDGTSDFRVFFDANNANKPVVLGTGDSALATPYVLNELVMTPENSNNNGIPVIPFGTTITDEFSVGDHTVAVGYTDGHGKNEGYLYQNGENEVVGQWPPDQDTLGYVALALVNNNVTPATTNYGWVHLRLNYLAPSPQLTVIDYAYEDAPQTDIIAGQQGPISLPAIYQSPTNQTVAAGVTVQLSVVALGDPAPTYEWRAGAVGSGVFTNLPNAGPFSGADTSTLTISDVTPANQLDYVVVVANSNGAVTSSPPATLTIISAEIAGPVPSEQMIYSGYPAEFTVFNLGGVATTNRWFRNDVPLVNGGPFSGANTTNLHIASVTPDVAGEYYATATNIFGSTASGTASLDVVYPDGSLYEASVRAYGAAVYYRLNETAGAQAWDFIGGKNGTYGSSALLGQSGPTPDEGFPGFAGTNYAATFQFLDPNNLLPIAPWNLNTNTVTITAWVYPQFDQDNAGIVYVAGTNNMVVGIRYNGGYANTNGISDGNIGYNWNNNADAWSWNSGITPPHNLWSLIALAVSPTNAALYIINSDGVQIANNSIEHPVQSFNAPGYIGTYPFEGALGNNNFNGRIDEVAVFKSTLSSNQVYSLYASALGQAVVPPAVSLNRVGGDIQVGWTGGFLLHSTNLLGPWTTNAAAVSPYLISPTNAQEFFRATQ